MPAQFVPLQAGPSVPIPVQQPILIVGRHSEVDVRVESAAISRLHCCVAVVNEKILIRDLGSRHGIYHNGLRVDEAEIRPGDEIAIGPLLYRLEADAPRTRPAEPAKPRPKPEPQRPVADDLVLGLIPLDDDHDMDLIPLDD